MAAHMRIRVPASWRVDHHELLEEDPLISDGVCTNLSEDLFQMHRGSETIGAGYYRDKYRVVLVCSGNWEQPLRSIECSHRADVAAVIEKWANEDALEA
jgi:hypothetical protein